jgi:phosphoglucosamine mutase
MVQSGKSLADLRVGMTKLPQELINVKSPAPGQTVKAEAVQEALIAAEQELGASGRILLRPSGTEPLVRVMVEGADPALILRIAQGLADVVEAAAA